MPTLQFRERLHEKEGVLLGLEPAHREQVDPSVRGLHRSICNRFPPDERDPYGFELVAGPPVLMLDMTADHDRRQRPSQSTVTPVEQPQRRHDEERSAPSLAA
jgi:hypothetical protein